MQDKCTTLIVDDNLLFRFVLAEMLVDNGFLVIQAGDAAEALACIDNRPGISAVTSDIDMPGELDGIGFARELRDAWPDLPIIMVSGCFEAPPELPDGVPFLPKPVPDRLLVAMLRQMTGSA
ncbi:response regulator [Alsobacter sp. KACC 23698]|uniref:Response regulator n=1 Tax=Alsobacter sp. KACC 23698 TaxID=3149229 RepID=A0AAU7JC21_9HYPH